MPHGLQEGKMESQYNNSKGQQPPSVDDIIEWHHEQSLCLGETGYTTQFPTADFFNTAPITNALSGYLDTSELLERVAQDYTTEYECVMHRMEYMKANKSLVIEAENEVRRRLLKAGKTEKDLGRYISKGASLRDQIGDLYDLQNRNPKPERNTIPAFIYYGSVSNKRQARVNLPVDASLALFKDLVKVYFQCLKDIKESLESIYHEDRPWKYKFKSRTELVQMDESLLPLEMEHDYKNLIRKMKSPGSSAFVLILTQEDWPGEKKTPQKRTPLYERHPESSPLELEDDGVESLFEPVNLANNLDLLNKGLIRGAEEEDLEELARAAQKFGREKANRDRAMRTRDARASMSRHGRHVQSSNRGLSQGQITSSPGKSDEAFPPSSPLTLRGRGASGANQSSHPPRAHGSTSAFSPRPRGPHNEPNTRESVDFTKEQERRSSSTKHFPSTK